MKKQYPINDPTATKLFSIICLQGEVAFEYLKEHSHTIILASGTLSPLEGLSSELNTDFKYTVEAKHAIDTNEQVKIKNIKSFEYTRSVNQVIIINSLVLNSIFLHQSMLYNFLFTSDELGKYNIKHSKSSSSWIVMLFPIL